MMTKLGKLFFFFVFWPVSEKGSFFGEERICVQHKGYLEKADEEKYTGKWEKLCREQCEMDSILQLDHTMIQCFSFFYFLNICIL